MVADTPLSSEITADGDLVRRVQNGDNEAFDMLFERHYSHVFNFVVRLAGNRDDAADISQLAFVRAFGSINRLRDGQAFLRWVYRTALNIVRDRDRQLRRRPWVSLLDLWRPTDQGENAEPVEFADPALNPETLTVNLERDHAVKQAIAVLPLEFREVVVLHHLQGLDIREIADVIGVPEGTVKSRLGRARQRLRLALHDWVETNGDGK